MATQVEYRYGLLTLSPDLREPGADSEPIAVVGTGHNLNADSWHVFALVRGDIENVSGAADDPVALAVLRQFIKNLSARVQAARTHAVPPTELLSWVAAGLGGSVSFSWFKTRTRTFPKSAAARMEIAPWSEFNRYLNPTAPTQRKSGPRAAVRPHSFSHYTVEPLAQPERRGSRDCVVSL